MSFNFAQQCFVSSFAVEDREESLQGSCAASYSYNITTVQSCPTRSPEQGVSDKTWTAVCSIDEVSKSGTKGLSQIIGITGERVEFI